LKGIFQRHVDGEISIEEFRAAVNELSERRFGSLSVSRNGRSLGTFPVCVTQSN